MLLTQREVAQQLGVSRALISELTKRGVMKHVILPGYKKARYTQEHIDTFLKQQEQGDGTS